MEQFGYAFASGVRMSPKWEYEANIFEIATGLGHDVAPGVGVSGAVIAVPDGVGLAGFGAVRVWDYRSCPLEDSLGTARRYSPIILDLDGDGVEASGSNFFDFKGDGFDELTRWVAEDDGLLVLDLNGNGVIDDGSELFGDSTVVGDGLAADGFAALAALDSNDDNVIDSQDAQWGSLQVLRWTDANGNGIMDDGESRLESLAANSVMRLNLANADSTKKDEFGNEHRQIGSYARTDGTTREMTDVWFDVNEELTRDDTPDIPEHSAKILDLQEMAGSGQVHNLRDAMVLDDAGQLAPPYYGTARSETRKLSELVVAFNAATESSARDVLLEKTLHRWAGSEGVTISDYGTWRREFLHQTTPQKLAVVEAFKGRQWLAGSSYREPSAAASAVINSEYQRISESLRAELVLQHDYRDELKLLKLKYGEEEVTADTDLSQAEPSDLYLDFLPVSHSLATSTSERKEAFIRHFATLSGNAPAVIAGLKKTTPWWLYEYQFHADYIRNGVFPSVRQNRLEGDDGVNVFRTTDGRNNELRGLGGDDMYQLVRGTGHDTVYESEKVDDTGDTIMAGLDIETGDMRLRRSSYNLHVELLGAADSQGVRKMTDCLVVYDHYRTASAQVEHVKFMDGSQWDADEFAAVLLQVMRGSYRNESIHGRADMDDVFDSDAGGDDSLYGYAGDDKYWLGRGTGHDTIFERDQDDGGHRAGAGDAGDAILLKAGIGTGDMRLRRSAYNLHVELLGAADSQGVRKMTDSLVVHDYYRTASARVEHVKFMDGTQWGADEFAAVFLQIMRGSFKNEHIYGVDVMDDVFDSDAGGNDNLHGFAGDDKYWLGRGTGHDTIFERDQEGGGHRAGAGDSGDAILLKAGIGIGDVYLRRDQRHLWVELLGAADDQGVRAVTDSLCVNDHYEAVSARVESVRFADGTEWGAAEFALVVQHGSSGNDYVLGSDQNDVFDSDAGGNDHLFGYGGDDIYRLGRGTGHDAIYELVQGFFYGRRLHRSEGDAGDAIVLKAGISTSDVRLRRDLHHLWVELLGAADDQGVRTVTDSLRVDDHYEVASAHVESVRFADGTEWGAAEFALVVQHGGSGDDNMHGSNHNDIFDSDAGGDDSLYGFAGNDKYWLGSGTGHDTIYERVGSLDRGRHVYRLEGEVGDMIALDAGIGIGDVRLRRDHRHLWVELLGAADAQGARAVTDSLRVDDHYEAAAARVESVRFADGTMWGATEFAAVVLYGGTDNYDIHHRYRNANYIYGNANSDDMFDSDGGGGDTLYGFAGDDSYMLGRGTGHDVINERVKYVSSYGQYSRRSDAGDAGDAIVLKAGIGTDDVRLRRDLHHLWVELLGAADDQGARAVTDSLRVDDHYEAASARVESVRFADGTEWGAAEFALVVQHGGSGDDNMHGSNHNDDFDSDAGGNDKLYGFAGNDIYQLGSGTGHDAIYERVGSLDRGRHVYRLEGDAGDAIVLKDGIGTGDVRLRRDTHHLWVELLGVADSQGARAVTDSLRVDDYYDVASARVELVRFVDGTTWGASEFALVALRGGLYNDRIDGHANVDDVFDSDAGGNDRLYGYAGNDIYQLGRGTGHDAVYESVSGFVHYNNHQHLYRTDGGDASDAIVLEAGIEVSDVRLRRDHIHLWVELLGAADGQGARAVTDSLRVDDYYEAASARVESVRFADDTWWGASELALVALRGGLHDDRIDGRADMDDVFDSDAGGNDRLYGYAGNDIYQLGRGTGHDAVYESVRGFVHYNNHQHLYRTDGGDAGDAIVLDAGIEVSDVRLRRDHRHLWVELLGAADGQGARAVTDSLRVTYYYEAAAAHVESVRFADGTQWGESEFALVALRGGLHDDRIDGRADMDDVFNSDAGGNDRLYGYAGDDIYQLGRGTGHDAVYESVRGFVHYNNHQHLYRTDGGDAGDAIVLDAGIEVSDVRLRRDHRHLWVELLGAADGQGARAVTDSLRVTYYYEAAAAHVESVRFADGTQWGESEFALVALRGGLHDDRIDGRADMDDVFDSDAGGNDRLYGYAGDDIYQLGRGTGHDAVYESVSGFVHYNNHQHLYRADAGDAGDAIVLDADIEVSDVRLRRDHRHLWVELLGAADDQGVREVTDSLRVVDYYESASARVESVKSADGTVLWNAFDLTYVALRGNAVNNDIKGNPNSDDEFDSTADGSNRLYGYAGDDTYWLGRGSGHDGIFERVGFNGELRTDSGDSADTIKLENGIAAADMRLRRKGGDLWVELLGTADAQGVREVTDSLRVHDYYEAASARVESVRFADGTQWGASEFALLVQHGGTGNDNMRGSNLNDVFDSDAGGDDRLFGFAGDDIYWLGRGTDHDAIFERDQEGGGHRAGAGDSGDAILLKAGIGTEDMRLRRNENDLWVELLGAADGQGVRAVSDSLRVTDHYVSGSARVEFLRFADGTAWRVSEMPVSTLRGGVDDEDIHGIDAVDLFDGDAGGNDRLFGYSGNDIYMLGRGTGHDVIYERDQEGGGHRTDGGDSADAILLKDGIGADDVRLRRDDSDLWVELLGAAGAQGVRAVTDSLRVVDYYESASARVESVKLADGTVLWNAFDLTYVALRGKVVNDDIKGNPNSDDEFDSAADGSNRQYGYAGDDTYWLGRGSGHDEIDERELRDGGHRTDGGDTADAILLKDGIGADDVRLSRKGRDLLVELLGDTADAQGRRRVTDSLRVSGYYVAAEARVESVIFTDKTKWGESELAAAPRRGSVSDEKIGGHNGVADVFDGDAGGNDKLFGYTGNDIYWLGRGTDHDVIYERYRRNGRWRSDAGDAGDTVRLEKGIGTGDVRLRRDFRHLWVELLGAADGQGARAVTDSLRVADHYGAAAARVESVRFADDTVWQGKFVVGADSADTLTSASSGTDTLYGGLGDDTYTIAGEFGEDRVVDRGGEDKVAVTGHDKGSLSFARDGDDMVMNVLGTDDRLVFDGWFDADGDNKVERVEVDGHMMMAASAERMATAMAAFTAGGGSESTFVSQSHGDYWQAIVATP